MYARHLLNVCTSPSLHQDLCFGALNKLILIVSGPGEFPLLSQIKPQAPLLVGYSINSFKFQFFNHTSPDSKDSGFSGRL